MYKQVREDLKYLCKIRLKSSGSSNIIQCYVVKTVACTFNL